ncbi:MAG: HAD family phosphatase [Richelia sp.]|nr:HAD family phosphatase [Richelia sp.]
MHKASGKKLIPLSESILSQDWQNIGLIATDMDGTLTVDGKFTSQLLQHLEHLATQEIKVLIVTGRSAGWVSGLSNLMPIAGAIAENGGLFYLSSKEKPNVIHPIKNISIHRQQLGDIFAQLKAKFPQIKESADNSFRITDWTFDLANFTIQELKIMDSLCQQMGWGFTYSSVQCHIKPLKQDKAPALMQVLQTYFPDISVENTVAIGDSPNDASLFDTAYFPVSVGVANILQYSHQIHHQPTFVTSATEGEGFCELATLILQENEKRKKSP